VAVSNVLDLETMVALEEIDNVALVEAGPDASGVDAGADESAEVSTLLADTLELELVETPGTSVTVYSAVKILVSVIVERLITRNPTVVYWCCQKIAQINVQLHLPRAEQQMRL
jgi:hypothetical protein|tara:strand:+ start:32940 stop:33281 length:342 start_codon:yes stop_codon:yes gene_type:complete